MKHYDILVIGAGGGTKLVTPPSNIGYKVAVLEKEKPGGTCLNRGCIPSKMLVYPADIMHSLKEVERVQIHLQQKPEVLFSNLIKRISNTVDEESDSIVPIYEKNPNVDLYPYEGRFVSNQVVEVNGQKLTADRIFIVTGARPFIPHIPGLEQTPFWTSREALRNTHLPSSLTVIGGGYIALELGLAYSAFGTNLNLIARSEILRKEDYEIQAEFRKSIMKHNNVYEHTTIRSIEYKDKEFILRCASLEKGEFLVRSEALLVATGVMHNSDSLGLENTDIQRKEDGSIHVNEYLETTVPGVYAFGDVVGNYYFRHSTNFEGEYLFDTLYIRKKKDPIQYPPMPHAVFTNPQVASVGLTEEACKEKGLNYLAATHSYSSSATGMARLPSEGMVKVIIDKDSQKLLGVHILGEEAANMLHQFILAMTIGASLDDLLRMIYIHPAINEIARNALRKLREKLSKN
ncbi:MAG: dihydrolipoyl dehydrogenase [Leptospiraceae bacterium]|nr:dihydrolipoyl dehydrogenase [Leptospiraceae bacterium]